MIYHLVTILLIAAWIVSVIGLGIRNWRLTQDVETFRESAKMWKQLADDMAFKRSSLTNKSSEAYYKTKIELLQEMYLHEKQRAEEAERRSA